MNKKILFAIPLITCLLASCSGKVHYEESKYQIGIKWEDTSKDFRILQLCDIHLSQSDIFERHFKVIDKTIKDANANLIVLNGDSFTYADKGVVTRLFSFIDSYDIPWTFTYGNHDDQGYYPDTYIQDILGGSKQLFKNVKFVDLRDDDVTGRSNFVINLYDRQKVGDQYISKDLFQVYLMESHSYNFDTIEYDFIKRDQIDWYERMVKYETEKSSGTVVPSAMYFHIPLPEFFTAWHEMKGDIENKHGSYPRDIINGQNASTDEFGGGPLPASDTHLFDKVKELGSTLAISCAHDHINDSVISYDDVALCFGVHSTDRIYYDAKKIGGQVIIVKAMDPSHKTLEFENIYHSYSEVEGK